MHDLTLERTQNIISKSHLFDLPSILRSLRRIHGITRHPISEATGISEKRLWALESGSYRYLKDEELTKIAYYYAIEPKELIKVARRKII